MKIRFLSNYDRFKNLVNILVEHSNGKTEKITENISPKPINPADIIPDIKHVLNADVLQKQNKGVN